jgi:hypothetical protein
MVRKPLSLILVGVLINAAVMGAAPVHAGVARETEAKRIEDVRTMVLAVGTGPQAAVRVKLRNNSRLNGFVSLAGHHAFSLRTQQLVGQPLSHIRRSGKFRAAIFRRVSRSELAWEWQ